jgi:hypothetical protein
MIVIIEIQQRIHVPHAILVVALVMEKVIKIV